MLVWKFPGFSSISYYANTENFQKCKAKKKKKKKNKYIPDEKYQWKENFKYETYKTKNLQRWNVILTYENDAILWVTTILMVSQIKKHITVGL